MTEAASGPAVLKTPEPSPCTDEEAAELAKLRKLLCLPKDAVAGIDRATKGRIFRTAVNDALGAGIDGFTQVLH